MRIMELEHIMKIRENRTDNLKQDKKMVDLLIKQKRRKEDIFETCAMLNILSSNTPEAFEKDIQEELSNTLVRVEESETKAILSSCMYNIIKEKPNSDAFLNSMNKLVEVKENENTNYSRENLSVYYVIKSWEECNMEVPEEIIKRLSEEKKRYNAGSLSALASLYRHCIVNEQESMKTSFSGLKSIIEKSKKQTVLNNSIVELAMCTSESSLDKKVLENYYKKYSDRLGKVERQVVEEKL